MISSILKGSIVKGIPNYILMVSILTPVILLSGVLAHSETEAGLSIDDKYEFLTRDWRTWSDEDWAAYESMIMEIESEEDIPPELMDFAYEHLRNEYEAEQFAEAYKDYIIRHYGLG